MKTRSTTFSPSITIRLTVEEAMQVHEMLYRAHMSYLKHGCRKSERGPQDLTMVIHRTIQRTHPELFPICFGFPAEDSGPKHSSLEPLPMEAPEDQEEIKHRIEALISGRADHPFGKDYDSTKEPSTKTVVHHHHHYPKPNRFGPPRRFI